MRGPGRPGRVACANRCDAHAFNFGLTNQAREAWRSLARLNGIRQLNADDARAPTNLILRAETIDAALRYNRPDIEQHPAQPGIHPSGRMEQCWAKTTRDYARSCRGEAQGVCKRSDCCRVRTRPIAGIHGRCDNGHERKPSGPAIHPFHRPFLAPGDRVRLDDHRSRLRFSARSKGVRFQPGMANREVGRHVYVCLFRSALCPPSLPQRLSGMCIFHPLRTFVSCLSRDSRHRAGSD